ncbi:hypothetical protein D3C73_807770 [compost metagenome]
MHRVAGQAVEHGHGRVPETRSAGAIVERQQETDWGLLEQALLGLRRQLDGRGDAPCQACGNGECAEYVQQLFHEVSPDRGAARVCGPRVGSGYTGFGSGAAGIGYRVSACSNEASMIGAVASAAGSALTLNRKSAVLCRSLAAWASTGPMVMWAWRNQCRETF